MKRLLPFVLALLTLLFPALASAQNQKGKITINQVEHCVLTVTYYNDLLEEVTVNSGDLVPINRMITAIPTLDSGYEIECYVVNGEEMAPFLDQSVTVTVKGDIVISAKVKKSEPMTITIEQPEHGTITVKDLSNKSAKVKTGDKVMTSHQLSIEVVPETGYKVSHWLINDEKKEVEYLSANKTTITVTKPLKISAVMKKIPAPSKLTLVAEPAGCGTFKVQQGSFMGAEIKDLTKIKTGSDVYIEFTPSKGYILKNWVVEGEEKPANPNLFGNYSIVVRVKKDMTVKAVLDVAPPVTDDCLITIETEGEGLLTLTDASGATIVTGAKVAKGTMLTVTAEAKDGYNFKSFTINNNEIRPDSEGVIKVSEKKYTYEFEVKENTVISAKFSKPGSAEDILAQTKEFTVVDGRIYCPGAGTLALYTMDGKLVRTIEAEVMEVHDLIAGNYLIIATNREGVALQKKIVL